MTISNFVGNIPEIYQPIYGYSEYKIKASRSCADRLTAIEAVYKKLEHKLGHPLRVLDLGCAQGFFCFNIAAFGATVVGIDRDRSNISLCNAIAQENPSLSVSFIQAEIVDFVTTLESFQFDIILGLSVFHHLCNENGVPMVCGMLEDMAKKTSVILLELALNIEPLQWAASLPALFSDVLQGVAFFHVIDEFPTHLSETRRPLVFASNQYLYLGGEIQKFDRYSTSSHSLCMGHDNGRRYYFVNNKLVKISRLSGVYAEKNLREHEMEVGFLAGNTRFHYAPKLHDFGKNPYEAWLIREMLPGILLSDLVLSGGRFDVDSVIENVLADLIFLENQGLFHQDLRLWNIVISPDAGVYIIDYGSIGRDVTDIDWPRNIYLSFILLVHEICGVAPLAPYPSRALAMTGRGLPARYSNWVGAIWSRSMSDWSFKNFENWLSNDAADGKGQCFPFESHLLWMKVVEEYTERHLHYLAAKGKQAEEKLVAKTSELDAKWNRMEATLKPLSPLIRLWKFTIRRLFANP